MRSLLERREQLGGEKVAHGFAAADEFGFGVVDEDFGGTGAGVVVGGQGHAVGSGVEQRDEVAGYDGGERAVAREEVSRLADGTHDIGGKGGLSAGLLDGEDLVVGLVERRADEVVHAGVGDDEGLGSVLLDEEDAGEQSSSLRHDEAAGFEEEVGVYAGEDFGEGGGVLVDLLGRAEVGGFQGIVIVDAEAPAGVDVADVVAIFAEVGDEGKNAFGSGGEGADAADLRADVNADAGGIEGF